MYVLVLILIVSIAFSAYNFYNSKYGASYQKAIAAQDPLDKCKTPQGYTDESWKEHMGHHPDMYKECF